MNEKRKMCKSVEKLSSGSNFPPSINLPADESTVLLLLPLVSLT